MKKLTVLELAELFLAVTFDESKKKQNVDLNTVAEKLGIEDRAKLINIAYYLEFDSLIDFRNIPAYASAMITSKGVKVVEHGGTSGIIAKYHEYPDSFSAGEK